MTTSILNKTVMSKAYVILIQASAEGTPDAALMLCQRHLSCAIVSVAEMGDRWPQQTWAKKWGPCPFSGRGAGPPSFGAAVTVNEFSIGYTRSYLLT